jgi:CBS domain-containing protein
MSLLELNSFIKGIVPFDTLDNYEIERISKELDVVYFKKDVILLSDQTKPEFLYFIIKGVVQEIHEDEVVSIYTQNEYFDPISLIENKVKHTFVTAQETICYALEREFFLSFMYEHEKIEGYFFQSISQKLNTNLSNQQNKEFVNFMISRVKDAYLQKPIIVDSSETIFNAVSILKGNKGSSLLVKNEQNELGIVTDTDFREKIILNRMSFDEPISTIATFGLKVVSDEEFLFNAQLTMNKYGIKRLIVQDEKTKEIVGVLDLIALTSFFASNTYAVTLELDKAESLEELKSASNNFERVIRTLYAKGVKVRYISKLVSQLNNKLFRKLFELIAPEELFEQSSLIIMGSEGRSEQILRTDQDNALILSDNCTVSNEVVEKFTQEFSNCLCEFGYPECSGGIMVNNPYWRLEFSDFKTRIYEWVHSNKADDFMNLAIFYDAVSVCGDEKLLIALKEHLHNICTHTPQFHSFFAKPIMNFETPLSMFANFIVSKKEHKDELDIKKGGIFAIVHGVRSLSLEYNIKETNTIERLKELNNQEVMDRETTSELIESFNFLLTLRLKTRLEKIDSGKQTDNYINPSNLNTLEKDLLRDSFKIVDKFKKFLTFHYKLNMLS